MLEQPDGGAAMLPRERGPVASAPGARLSLSLPPLVDYRVRVFDGADRVVASDDTAQASDAGIEYAIALVEPLKRGRDYRVLVDAETGAGLAAPTGRRYLDAEWNLSVEGPAEPDPPPQKSSRAKRKPGKRRR